MSNSIHSDRTSLLIGSKRFEKGPFFDKNIQNYTRVYEIDNIYNRLVLFRENVLHQAAAGFGTEKNNGRLTQTFFFEV